MSWYIGEIHVIATGLRPNLRRNAFEESEDTRRFVKQLRSWYEELDHSTRVYSYFRGKKKAYTEYEEFLDRLLTTPKLWDDDNDRKKLTQIEAVTQEDEEIVQKSKSRRANEKAVHPHEKEALSEKELRATRKRILGKVADLRKRDGALKHPTEVSPTEKEPESSLPANMTSEDERGEELDNPTASEGPLATSEETDIPHWIENDTSNGNEETNQNTLIEIMVSLLDQIMTEERLPQSTKMNVIKKLRERLLIVVGNEQESLS